MFSFASFVSSRTTSNARAPCSYDPVTVSSQVVGLHRVSVLGITLDGLDTPGQWKDLTDDEMSALRAALTASESRSGQRKGAREMDEEDEEMGSNEELSEKDLEEAKLSLGGGTMAEKRERMVVTQDPRSNRAPHRTSGRHSPVGTPMPRLPQKERQQQTSAFDDWV